MTVSAASTLFEKLFETSPQPTLLGVPYGPVVAANRAALAALGYSAEEVLLLTQADFVDLDAQAVTLIQATRQQDGYAEGELELKRKDGSRFLVWARSALFGGEDGQTYASFHFDDITERRKLALALRESEEQYRRLIEAMAEGMVVLDPLGNVTSCNAAACEMLGTTEAVLLTMNSHDARWRTFDEHGEELPSCEQAALRALRTRQPVRNSVMGVQQRAGAVTWLTVNAVPVFNARDELKQIVCTFSDITARRSVEANLLLQAQTDALTGLANRRALEARTELLKQNAAERPFSLLQLDIDHFKAVNDAHGHVQGDTVLQAVAQALRECLRLEDLPARTGGEEFCVLLPGSATANALKVSERIRACIADKVITLPTGQTVRVTVSIGVTCCTTAEFELTEQLERADRALYRAKQLGRNKVVMA